MRRLTAAAPLLFLAASILLPACGGTSNPPSGAGPAGAVKVDIRVADCTDWNRQSVEDRLRTVGAIRDAVRGPAGEGVVLPNDKAYGLFERICDSPNARAFTLYVLYVRAAAFQSVSPRG
jgi:hypothetical protein